MKQLSNLEIASFCEELAWILHSGVSVAGGLSLIAEEEQEKGKNEYLQRMADDANEGIPIAEIFNKENGFPTYVQGIIRVGEYTGCLEEALQSLAKYYEKREHLNRQIKMSLMYPSILLVLMLAVIAILLTKVLPIFESVFVSLGGSLSGVAGALFKFGLLLNKAMPILCVIGILLVVLGLVVLFHKPTQNQIKLWIRKMVGDKGIMRKINDASFAQAVSMGLSSGLVMEETMDLAMQLLDGIPTAQERCICCKEELTNGTPLVDALKKSEVFPAAACRLLSLGMQSGSGDVVMEEIANRLSEEADEALADKVAKIEPTLVLVTSVMVGAILLSVMLPLMNVMQLIG